MQKDWGEVAGERTRITTPLQTYRDKIYTFRRLMAGDLSTLSGNGQTLPDDPTQRVGQSTPYYDMLVNSWEEGRSNQLFRSVVTLHRQVAYASPDFEFADLDADLAMLNSAYLKMCRGPAPYGCSATPEEKLALMSYMIDGIGFAMDCYGSGKPMTRWCDTLDMNWDTLARTPDSMQWASCTFRLTIAQWIKLGIPASAFAMEIASNDASVANRVMPMVYYYDLDGYDGLGCEAIFKGNNIGTGTQPNQATTPVVMRKTPYYYQFGKMRMPFIPYRCCYMTAMPSVRRPVGVVEQMFPEQMALWEVTKYIRDCVMRGAPFYTMREGSLSEEQMQKLLAGDIGTIVELRAEGKIELQAPIEIPTSVLDWQQMNSQQLTSQSGANPYSTGNKVQGIEFASEVNAIQSSSGLDEGAISKDYTLFLTQGGRNMLAIGQANDDREFPLRVGGQILTFNQANPIKDYLFPDADILVREDSVRFQPKQSIIAQDTALLAACQSMAMMLPNAPIMGFKKLLQDSGISNVGEWLKPPEPTQMMGDPNAQDTRQLATTSTAQ